MKFSREGTADVDGITEKKLRRELLKLRSYGPSSYAVLSADDGSYLQVAGGGMGCLLEWRDVSAGQQCRAWQESPVVPFADGDRLTFSAGSIPLRKDEWFRIEQVIEAACSFLRGETFPEFIRWRDISGRLKDGIPSSL